MIILFTDFGSHGPYLGQMKAVLQQHASTVPVIDLFSGAPCCDPELSAYLLAAYVDEFPLDSVFLCVVDPGVGGARAAVIVRADGRWFVGPDNGLFNTISKLAHHVQWWEITWQPQHLSASFHGRDLFAPVAAHLARHETPPGRLREAPLLDTWPVELAKVIYIDHFGNCITGLRAASMRDDTLIRIGSHTLRRARTFGDVGLGQGFWYENANGLVELAVNQGRAEQQFGLVLGATLECIKLS
ncbi:MAG: SAM-dependent chlorinase/fluorinase [Gammaproteobacteria bacterium]|nr:SAM-dependent chlorinase/fluorinase [Gammaproteobacteria bacterium]